jgi:Ca2+-binding RTX toxin-like protein
MTVVVTVTTTADSDLKLVESMLNGTIDTSGSNPDFFWVTGPTHLVLSAAGSTLVYDGFGNIIAGSITEISVETAQGGNQIATITGLIVDAAMLYQAMLNDDESAIRALLFSSNIFEYTGNAGNDTFTAGDLFDTLDGGEGNDVFDGGAGGDTLSGGFGNDILNGGDGDDTLIGNQGSDILNGGDGNDWVSYDVGAPNSNSITINLATQTAISSNGTTADILSSIEFAQGGTRDDTIIGSAGSNVLHGGAGNDRIEGGAGDDFLHGEDGDDILIGNQGSDDIAGNDGNDTVSYDVGAPNSNSVTIDLAAQIATGSGGSVDTLNSIENAVGGTLDDTLIGSTLDNVLSGGDGDDAIHGGDGNDTIAGGQGADSIHGDAGDDLILGNQGTDVIDGGDDNDTVSYMSVTGPSSNSFTINLSTQTGTSTGGAVETLANIENAIGGSLHDILIGDAAANVLRGADGNDVLDGGLEVDSLFGDLGNDTFILGAENDAVDDSGGFDTIISSVSRSLASYVGIEQLILTGGNVNSAGNQLNNTLKGTSGVNILDGASGNDSLQGGAGNDRLLGGSGNDTLDGGSGNDRLEGGAGNDAYIINSTRDVLIDSSGTDTVKSTVGKTLATGFEHLILLGTAKISATGNSSSNSITGNSAINKLSGLSGNDTLNAGSGNDILIGGTGRDIMTGGAGADDFDFNSISEMGKTSSKRDVIKDFTHGSDNIDLSTIDANGSAAGSAAFKFLAAKGAAFTGVAGQLHWYQQNLSGTASDKTIIEGDLNGDRRADFQIQLSGLKTLSAVDFVL